MRKHPGARQPLEKVVIAMTKSTCKINECESPVEGHGYCVKHYKRWKKHGDPHKTKIIRNHGAPCKIPECEKPATRRAMCNRHYERFMKYGDPNGAYIPNRLKQCSIEGCDKHVDARSLCSTHYTRWLKTGSPERPCKTCGKEVFGFGQSEFCSDDCRPTCSFSDCSRICDGNSDLCKDHRSGVYQYGRLPQYEWSKDRICIVCGTESTQKRYRKVCSEKCKQLLFRNGGTPPEKIKQCVKCTGFIDLTVIGKSGRKKRADTKFCEPCKKSRVLPHQMSVTELADRDGTICGICSTNVDMTLEFPNTMRASVDHIIPVASGGDNDPENLQLAHLHCNFIKSSRDGFTLEKPPI